MRWAGSSTRRAANRGSTIRSSSSRPTTGASSAGKTEIPLEKYHIPAMIYAPAFVTPAASARPRRRSTLMPDALLAAGYGLRLVVLRTRPSSQTTSANRAFVATYQDLGYLEGDRFTVLSPVDRAEQFLLRPTDDDPYALERTERSTARTSIVPFRSIRPPRNGTNDKQVPESVR